MPCICTTNSLRGFIRSLANFDVNPKAFRQAANISTATTSRRDLNTSKSSGEPVSFCRIERNSTAKRESNSSDWIPFSQEEPHNLRSSKTRSSTSSTRVTFDQAKDLDSYKTDYLDHISAENVHGTGSDAAVLEVNPGTIELLANEVKSGKAQHNATASQIHPRRKKFLQNTEFRLEAPREKDLSTSKESSREFPLPKDWEDRREPWQIQKAALKNKFEEGWKPHRRLSPDALAGIRALHTQFPEQYPTEVLADKFEVSPEAIRRILKSKWTPSAEEELDRRRRWLARGVKVWSHYADQGAKPPARWREMGVHKKLKNGDPNSPRGSRWDVYTSSESLDRRVRTTSKATEVKISDRFL